MADGVIARLAVAVQADTKRYQAGMARVKKEAAATKKVTDGMLSKIGGGTLAGAAVVGMTALTAAVAKGVQQFNKMRAEIDATAKSARKLGLTYDSLKDLRFAADLEGISNVDTAIQRATRRISQAAAGQGEARKALAELGLSAENLNRLSPDRQLEAIAEQMGAVSNDADRMRLAVALFDSEGADMVRLLDGGAQKVRNLQREARALRGDFGNNAAALEAFNDQGRRSQEVLDGLYHQATLHTAIMTEAALSGKGWAGALSVVTPGLGLATHATKTLNAETQKAIKLGEQRDALVKRLQLNDGFGGSVVDPAAEAAKIAAQDAQTIIDKLGQSIIKMQGDADRLAIQDAISQGADPAYLKQYDNFMKAQEEIAKQQERQVKLEAKALSLKEQSLTAEQRLAQEARDINQMRQQGLISTLEQSAAEKAALQSFVQGKGQDILNRIQALQNGPGTLESLNASTKGSAEAFATIDRSNKRGIMERQIQTQTKALQTLVKQGEKLLRNAQQSQPVTVQNVSI